MTTSSGSTVRPLRRRRVRSADRRWVEPEVVTRDQAQTLPSVRRTGQSGRAPLIRSGRPRVQAPHRRPHPDRRRPGVGARLSARLVRWVVDRVAEREGGPQSYASGVVEPTRRPADRRVGRRASRRPNRPQALPSLRPGAGRFDRGLRPGRRQFDGRRARATARGAGAAGFGLSDGGGLDRLGGVDFDEVCSTRPRGAPSVRGSHTDAGVLSRRARRECTGPGELSAGTGVDPRPCRAAVGRCAAPQRVRVDDPPAGGGDGRRAAQGRALRGVRARSADGGAARRRVLAHPAGGAAGVGGAGQAGRGRHRPEERDREGRGAVGLAEADGVLAGGGVPRGRRAGRTDRAGRAAGLAAAGAGMAARAGARRAAPRRTGMAARAGAGSGRQGAGMAAVQGRVGRLQGAVRGGIGRAGGSRLGRARRCRTGGRGQPGSGALGRGGGALPAAASTADGSRAGPGSPRGGRGLGDVGSAEGPSVEQSRVAGLSHEPAARPVLRGAAAPHRPTVHPATPEWDPAPPSRRRPTALIGIGGLLAVAILVLAAFLLPRLTSSSSPGIVAESGAASPSAASASPPHPAPPRAGGGAASGGEAATGGSGGQAGTTARPGRPAAGRRAAAPPRGGRHVRPARPPLQPASPPARPRACRPSSAPARGREAGPPGRSTARRGVARWDAPRPHPGRAGPVPGGTASPCRHGAGGASRGRDRRGGTAQARGTGGSAAANPATAPTVSA